MTYNRAHHQHDETAFQAAFLRALVRSTIRPDAKSTMAIPTGLVSRAELTRVVLAIVSLRERTALGSRR
jgi:hypothetical protein